MMSKPLVVVVATAAVVGAAVVSVSQLRGKPAPARTASASSSVARALSNVASHQSATGAGQRSSNPLTPVPSPVDVEHPDSNPNNNNGSNNNGFGGNKNRSRGHRQDRAKNGSYVTVIAGFYNGTGTAEVKDDRVSIKAEVTRSDGRTGVLVAPNLTVDGPYFYGSGTILGEAVQVSGRVDAARASRLTATFAGSDGRAARVVGNLPGALDTGDENWDGDDAGRHRQ
jgi:hypothetical protein